MTDATVQAIRSLLRDIPFHGVPRLARPHFRMEMSAWLMLSALGILIYVIFFLIGKKYASWEA